MIAASPPPTTNKTVFGFTSPIFLTQNPKTKNAGSDKNREILLKVEKLFEYELNEPIPEIRNKIPTGSKSHKNSFLFFAGIKQKIKPKIASIAPAKPKIYEILPKLNAVKATTSSIRKVIIDLFLTKKLSFIVISIISTYDMFRYLKF